MSKTKVICVTNQKGGVGKTTTTANLAYALAQAGRDVLVIDYDSQASLTNYLNIGNDDEDYYGTYEMMICNLRYISPEQHPIFGNIDVTTDEGFRELCRLCITRPTYLARVRKTGEDGRFKVVDEPREFGFDLMPSSIELSDYELEVSSPEYAGSSNAVMRLSRVIHKICNIYHEYDYVLIDTNPSLGIMVINAICAATTGVLIPTNLDLMSIRGVRNLTDRIAEIQERLEPMGIDHYGVIGILMNLYSERRTVDKIVEDSLDRFYPFKLFDARIPESAYAKNAVLGGLIYSQVHTKARESFAALAVELEATIAEMEKKEPQILYFGEDPEESEDE